jgi:hypothetical protein
VSYDPRDPLVVKNQEGFWYVTSKNYIPPSYGSVGEGTIFLWTKSETREEARKHLKNIKEML